MKIIALQAENVKRLVAVEITPKGNLVEITGKNGQGKTSILDAIYWALAGRSAVQSAPIRKGEKEARIKLDLGEIIVKRTFKKSDSGEITTSISVESKEGAKFPSPQAMLDKLFGELSFDPLAFSRMAPRDQFDALKKLVPGVNFDEIERLNKSDFESRTVANRKAKEARAAQNSIQVSEDGPVSRIDEAAMVAEMEAAAKENADIERRKVNRETANNNIADIERRVHAMKADIEKLLAESAELQKKLDAAPALPEPKDLSSIRVKIDNARAENKVRLDREGLLGHKKEAERQEAESKRLTVSMDNREIDKRLAIEKAQLPVEGLGFGEGSILLNGIPFDQASDAEQLRVSVAIAMALNPKLRVIRVRDGSLLDDSSMGILAELANDRDYQVWVETCHNGGRASIVMEDGHAREQAEKETAKSAA